MNVNPLRWWRGRAADEAEIGAPGGTPDATEAQLSAYLDGELAADEQTTLEAALAADEGLRAELEELRFLRESLAMLGEVRAPRSFAIAAPRIAPRASRLEVATRLGAAVASLAFVVALVGGEPGGLWGGVPSSVQSSRAETARDTRSGAADAVGGMGGGLDADAGGAGGGTAGGAAGAPVIAPAAAPARAPSGEAYASGTPEVALAPARALPPVGTREAPLVAPAEAPKLAPAPSQVADAPPPADLAPEPDAGTPGGLAPLLGGLALGLTALAVGQWVRRRR